MSESPPDDSEVKTKGVSLGHVLGSTALKNTVLTQQVQNLQEKLEKEKDARLEERFIGIVFLIIIFDAAFFTAMPSSGGPLALVVLQLFVLIPLARRMGMEKIAEMASRVIGRISDSMKND